MRDYDEVSLEGFVNEQLAKVYRMQGNIKHALLLHQKALLYTKKSGDKYQICSAPGSYGTTLLLAGKLKEGVENLSKSIANSRAAGYSLFVCTGLRSKTVGLMYMGRDKLAETCGIESFQIAERLGDIYNMGFARLVLGQVYTEVGDDTELTRSMLESSIEDFNSVGAQFDLGNAWIAMGNFYTTQGETVNAKIAFDKAYELLSSVKFKYGMGWLHYYLGELYFFEKKLIESKDNFSNAVEIAHSISSLYLETKGILGCAKVSILQGEVELGYSLLEKAKSNGEIQQYSDIVALASFNIGKLKLMDDSPEGEVFNYFWEALTFAIQYNCFLFDKLSLELRAIYDSDTHKSQLLFAIMNNIVDNWNEVKSEGQSKIDLEREVRQREMDVPYSNLEKNLFGDIDIIESH